MIKNHSICDGNLYQIQSSKMNNRQYYKAKEKGPEGPLGFPINLPKRGIQANAKGSKRPRGFLVSHQEGGIKTNAKRGQRATWVFSKPPKRGIKTNAKRGQRATWVFNKPPARGIRTLYQISAELPGKLVQQEKAEFYYLKGKPADHLDQTGIRTQKRSGQ